MMSTVESEKDRTGLRGPFFFGEKKKKGGGARERERERERELNLCKEKTLSLKAPKEAAIVFNSICPHLPLWSFLI